MVRKGKDFNENQEPVVGLLSNFTIHAEHKLTTRELFARAALFGNASVKLNMTPPPHILKILRELKEAGYENPIAFGGALRNAYLEEKGIALPKGKSDIDIALKPAGGGEFFRSFEHNPSTWFIANSAFAEHTANLLKEKIGGILSTSLEKADTYKEFDACIEANYQDSNGNTSKLDLCFSDARFSTEKMALSGDAPINAIAMDSDGNIFAHRDFAAHAQRLVYRNMDKNNSHTRAAERFTRLKEKLPGLINITDSTPSRLRNAVRKLTGINI